MILLARMHGQMSKQMEYCAGAEFKLCGNGALPCKYDQEKDQI
jgi:hypothetical protein